MKSQKSKMKRISAMILSLALLLCAAVPAMAEAAKDETVYILSDAQGEARRIIVSDWLKNPDKLDELTDATRLTNLTVVEGNATFERDGERLTWDADGKDVYYQGDSDEELPLTLQITYLVDGEEVPAADMAGKSGRVTIRFSYTPADGQKAQFAVLSAALLDSDRFTNVEVTNGAVINDGDRLLVLGVALPGLKERLDVEDKDGKLPETVEITADVEDFALPLTVTAASSEWSSLLKDMDLSLIDTADGEPVKEEDLILGTDVKLVEDYKGNQLLLFASPWAIQCGPERSDGRAVRWRRTDLRRPEHPEREQRKPERRCAAGVRTAPADRQPAAQGLESSGARPNGGHLCRRAGRPDPAINGRQADPDGGLPEPADAQGPAGRLQRVLHRPDRLHRRSGSAERRRGPSERQHARPDGRSIGAERRRGPALRRITDVGSGWSANADLHGERRVEAPV